MRIAAYARFSTDMQREASLDDQLRNCRGYAARHDWSAPVEFTDARVSGSRGDRPGYRRLFDRIHEFDVLLVDDLSRLTRDKDECGRIVKRLTFAGVRLIGVSDGVDTARKSHKADVGLRGLMSELYLDDLAEKTHRGLAGRALAGASAGGLAYGYRVSEIGRRVIDDAQADIVRRIFAETIKGIAPIGIADGLNRDGVPSPRGSTWAASAIRADKRGVGILGNELYIGRQHWNRSKWVKHPDTGRRLRRDNPKSEWITTEHPELAIVDLATWEAAQAVIARNRHKGTGPGGNGRRPRHLMTGLLKCQSCGGPIVSVDATHYGCATRSNRGKTACPGAMRVRRTDLDNAMLCRLRDDLLSDSAFERLQRAVSAELRHASDHTEDFERRIAAAERERDNVMAAIRAGIITPSTRAALVDAEAAVEALRGAQKRAQRIAPAKMLPRLRERWTAAVAALSSSRDVNAAREAIRETLGDDMVLKNENGATFVEVTPSQKVASMIGSGGRI